MDFTVKSAIEIALQTASSLYEGTIVRMVVLLVALLCCFAGYKLLRGCSAIVGIIFGVLVSICVIGLFGGSMSTVMSMILTVLLMIVLSVVCGLLFFDYYRIGVCIACAVIGAMVIYIPALFVAQSSMAAFGGLLLGCAVLFGATGLLFLRPASILMTSVFGFLAAYAMIDLAGSAHDWKTLALGFGLTAAGCVIQFVTNRGDALPFGKSRENSSETNSDETTDNGVSLSEPASQNDTVSDDTHGIDLSQLPQEEPDEIDSISDMVAAHINLGDTSTEPTISFDLNRASAMKSDDPETVDDSTIVMSLNDAEKNGQEDTSEAEEGFTILEEIKTDGTIIKRSEQAPESMGETVVRGAWNDVLAAAEPKTEEEPAELTNTGKMQSAIKVFMEIEADQYETESWIEEAESEDLTEDAEAEEAREEAEESPSPEESVNAESPVQPEETDSSVLKETDGGEKKPRKKGGFWSVLLIILAVAAAAVGVHYAEIVLGLCVLCCALHRYRTAEFACAILCVRRVVEAVLVITSGESWLLVVPYVLSAVVFLSLMVVIMRVSAAHTDEKKAE